MNGGEKAVRDIVRSVIDAEARHELGYFERLERFDDPWVVWRLRHPRHRDEPLGIGVGDVAPLVTPDLIANDKRNCQNHRRRHDGMKRIVVKLTSMPFDR